MPKFKVMEETMFNFLNGKILMEKMTFKVPADKTMMEVMTGRMYFRMINDLYLDFPSLARSKSHNLSGGHRSLLASAWLNFYRKFAVADRSRFLTLQGGGLGFVMLSGICVLCPLVVEVSRQKSH